MVWALCTAAALRWVQQVAGECLFSVCFVSFHWCLCGLECWGDASAASNLCGLEGWAVSLHQSLQGQGNGAGLGRGGSIGLGTLGRWRVSVYIKF